jgi:hypothetical protein
MSYCKAIYNDTEDNYKESLIDSINNKNVWDLIFNNYFELLTYYLHLSVDHLSVLGLKEKTTYTQNRLSTIYTSITFQEYIDGQVSLEKSGPADYQTFIRSMQSPLFKEKMVEKFNVENHMKTLKNHIIYVVKLYISKQINKSTTFTETEMSDIDFMINAIPYFEFLDEKRFYMEGGYPMGDYIYGAVNISTNEMVFGDLETRVLEYISKII